MSGHHVPSPLHLPDFDEDDAFDTADDGPSLAYAFSPDAIREEMARNMPNPAEVWDDEPVASSSAPPSEIHESDHNQSVSTLDIDTDAAAKASESYEDFGSSASATFSQISLDTSPDEHVPRLPESAHAIDHVHAHFNGIDSSYDNNHNEDHDQETVPRTNGFSMASVPETAVEQERLSTTPPHAPPSLPPHERMRPVPGSVSLPPMPLSAPADVSKLSPPHSAPSFTSQGGSSSPSTAPASRGSQEGTSNSNDNDNASTLLTEKTFPPRRSRRSLGPSAFEKVMSKTRPIFLPPKPKEEDDKHMADWQHIMHQSRIMADKRRKALQERRMAREKAIEDSAHIWEKDILPDWRIVNRNAQLRKLWWRGIPTRLRAPLWEKAVGNGLALSKDHYRICLSRAKRALSSGVFPQATLDLMDQDISTTLPSIHLFLKETGPMYPDLKDMLCAWVVSRSDEGLGYTVGAAKIAAMLLINMPNQQAFIVMRNLLERHCMRSFFGGERAKDDVEAYYRIFDTMLADGMPKIYFNFKQHQISPGAYFPDWVIPLFLDHLPFEACARIWDVLLLEGDSFIYRAALGILAVLEPRLFFPDRKELMELLRGENKAAIDVAKREGRPMNGGKYEIYGVDEETLWERIESMNEWWKDNTWTRLIQRELPDL